MHISQNGCEKNVLRKKSTEMSFSQLRSWLRSWLHREENYCQDRHSFFRMSFMFTKATLVAALVAVAEVGRRREYHWSTTGAR